jgi:hypothetical protein
MTTKKIKTVWVWTAMIALALSIPLTALAAGIGKEGRIVNKKGKANTIAELVAMYDSSACIECHQ